MARDSAERLVRLALPQHPGGGQRRSRRSPNELILRAPAHMYVPRLLQQKGFAGYEPESLACFLTAIEVTKRGAVLDVGANVGVYGVLASALTGRQVVAFEPAPDLAVTARAIADENGLSITLEEVALGAAPGRATLYLSDTTDSSNSLAQGFRPSTRQVDVRVETLDEVVQRMGLTASVIKIDTEMTEPDVLRGAEGTIRRHRPWILCEILAGRTEAQLTEIIEPWGYTWYHVTDDPPWAPAQELAGDPTYKNFMWLFAPTPLDGRFWSGLRGWRGSLAACVPLPAEAPRAEAPEAPLSERAAPTPRRRRRTLPGAARRVRRLIASAGHRSRRGVGRVVRRARKVVRIRRATRR